MDLRLTEIMWRQWKSFDFRLRSLNNYHEQHIKRNHKEYMVDVRNTTFLNVFLHIKISISHFNYSYFILSYFRRS